MSLLEIFGALGLIGLVWLALHLKTISKNQTILSGQLDELKNALDESNQHLGDLHRLVSTSSLDRERSPGDDSL